MTSKEKAIEALEEYNEHLTFIPCVRNIPIIDEAIKYLKQPTLDDAIKVVEKKLNKEYIQIDTATGQVERSYYRSRSGALCEVLTALKGLKGE